MKSPKPIPWKTRLHEVIFEADTFLGKFFDISLLILILFSVAAVMIESVEEYSIKYNNALTHLNGPLPLYFH